ncbi:MAG: tripartite tricarboxylate transporter substrate binding protein [Betaproteobacteria bacterium]|nr:tripartite tricarboxylate transporter substrate binding protein [Betaproteobacteria bacterium]
MARKAHGGAFDRRTMVRASVLIGVLSGCLLTPSIDAVAQATPSRTGSAYPIRPVRLIIPYAPGGASDSVARILGQKLSASLGHSFVIDNRPGAAGTLGRGIVAKAVPDGYTLLIGDSTHAVTPHVMRWIPYHAINDFDPITLLATTPQALVVNGGFQAQTLKDLIRLAKAQPATYNYGSGGSGSLTHLTAELFKLTVGANLTHVPYKSIGIAITELLGNQIHAAFPSLPGVVPHVRTGRLRALAVASPRRSTALPDAPTFGESGVSGMVVINWVGVMGPAGMPKNVVSRIHDEVVKAVRASDTQEKFSAAALDVATTTPEEFKAMLKSEFDRWGKVVKQAGVKPDE